MSNTDNNSLEMVRASGYFDEVWYIEQYPDVVALGMDPVEHYLWVGASLGRDPSEGFSSRGYLVVNPDVTAAGQNPLLHFLNHGIYENRIVQPSHPGPDGHAYNPTAKSIGERGAAGAENGGGITPLDGLFDARWYAATYLDVASSGMDPWQHFLAIGKPQHRNPNAFFDRSWYLMRNADVAAAGGDPLDHYLRCGAAERRDPGPAFNSRFYVTQLGKGDKGQANLLAHFLSSTSDPRLLASPADVCADLVVDRLGTGLQLAPITLHIGIVAYNQSLDELGELLRSCKHAIQRAGTEVNAALTVFDNGNNLRKGDLVDGVTLLANARNDGFGRAHNLLMERAFANGADAYLAVNPDGALHPDCIRNLLLMNQRHGGKALIEALQFPEEHPKFYHPETMETDWISGACFLMSREIWEGTKGFDPNIFLYCEDVDLSWSARRLGFATLSCPTALFYHDVSDRPYSARTWREMLVAGRYLAHKWHGDPAFTRFVEAEAVKAGFVKNPRELPLLPANAVLPDDHDVGQWEYMFSFTRTRW